MLVGFLAGEGAGADLRVERPAASGVDVEAI